MPPGQWLLLATALYLLPLVLAYFAAPKDDATLAAALFRVTVALAVDVALVCAIATVVPVSVAALATRAVYVVLYVAARIRGHGRVDHDLRGLAGGVLGAAIVIAGYARLSWHYSIWDRQWHTPLVTSLEGQSLPFANVFNAGRLPYHLGGDLIAAELRALSLDHLSSAAALSLAHDLFIGLGVGWLVLACRALKSRSSIVPMLGAIALALHGAVPRFIGPLPKDEPFFPFGEVSYRPHVPVSLFASVMLVTAIVSRVLAPGLRGARRAMCAAVFVGSICDEASIGIYGLALGVTWLAYPRVLGRTRLQGIGVLAALLVAAVVPNVLITGTIGHGSAVHVARWVSPRFAGMEGESTPLFSAAGLFLGATWLAAPLAAIVALVVSRFRRREPAPTPVVGFAVAAFVVGLVLGLCLLVNDSAGEAQRFYVAPFVAPITCAVLLAPMIRGALRPVAGLVIGVPAILGFYRNAELADRFRTSEYTAGVHNTKMPLDLFGVDCDEVTELRVGERPAHVYIDTTGFRLYSACRSVHVPGNLHSGWGLAMEPELGPDRQRDMAGKYTLTPKGTAACWRNRGSDGVCADLKAKNLCTPSSRLFVECELEFVPAPARTLQIPQGSPSTSTSASAM